MQRQIYKDYTCRKVLQEEFSSLVAIVEKNNKTYCLKAKRLQPTTFRANNFLQEVKIYRSMAEHGIAPAFIESYTVKCKNVFTFFEEIEVGVMVTEKYDYTYQGLLEYNTLHHIPTSRVKEIDQLISRMHALGVIHGDLHSGNIVVKRRIGKGRKYAIIDFGASSYLHEISKERLQAICVFGPATIEAAKQVDRDSYLDL